LLCRSGSSVIPATLIRGGLWPLNRELQLLGRTERDFLACFDLDRFSGTRITPHASCPLSNLQDTETRNTDSFAFLEMLGDKADEIAEQGFTGPFR
jgi:hypothetical protein